MIRNTSGYTYASVAFTIALLTIAFDQMHDHGWLTAAQVDVLSFVLSVWTIFTLGAILAQLLKPVVKRYEPLPAVFNIFAAFQVAGFAIMVRSTAPASYVAEATSMGACIGAFPGMLFVFYADPVHGWLEGAAEWLDARFGDQEVAT
jgi:hypothetical protein